MTDLNALLTKKHHHQSMVVNRRLYSFAMSILLYCVAGSVGSYFVWHAANGQRGLKAKAEYKREMKLMTLQLADLQVEKTRWSRRVELMRGQTINRDILDEEARQMLGRISPDELIVMLPGNGAR